ncbi:hypothetical protein IA854_05470 [Listeria seeligeri]|uniref:hypothetical protein n=1 Tax=Listeria seeligeri TaxID=1640 RepID=UPI0018894B4C|nr:hypothetical protein [Listeria seeligeri]MBF2373596.1 hypothetical protein [Listeria seeligeri]
MEEKRMVEINGIKMEIDMRTAVRVDEFKVGDNIKVLDKNYSNQKIHDGVIVEFLNFKDLPTIQIAYFERDWSGSEIKFLNINSESDSYEILPASAHEFELEKSAVVEKMKLEIESKKEEAARQQSKLDWFEKFYGKYFAKGEME